MRKTIDTIHIFLIVKKQFGYAKVTYRGIEKNLNRCYVLFARADEPRTFAGVSTPIFRKIWEMGKKEGGETMVTMA